MKNNLLKKMFFVAIMISSSIIFAQTVSGSVSDSSGPLPGANVVVQGTTNGVTADFDGNYTIDNVASDAVLEVSFIGYDTQVIAVDGQTTINVVLSEDATALNEVVVVGYNTQTRGDLTGSVASVDMEDALKAPMINASEALQGRVTGVTVINNGSPGGTPKINIRGFGTSNNTNPLFIIDGVQTDDPNILNAINASDIEQMNVLKDGAAAIYGARASNGVVIITTKSGGYNMNDVVVTVDAYTGFSKISNSPDMLTTQQHGEMLFQSLRNDNVSVEHPQYGSGSSPVIPSRLQRIPDGRSAVTVPGGGGTNWIDAVTQTAPTSNISMSLANGSETGKYFMSVNYLTRDGVIIRSGFQRISTRLNSEFKPTSKLTIGEHVNISFTETGNSPGVMVDALRMSPLIPLRDDDGAFAGTYNNDTGLSNTRSPYAQLERSKNNYNKRYGVFGDVYLEYDILDELTFKTTLSGGMGTFNSRFFTSVDPEHSEPITTASLAEQDQINWNWTWTNTLNYNKKFGEHSVNALVGIEALKTGGKGKGITRTDYLFESPDFYLLSNGAGTPNVDYAYDGFQSLFSMFGTANYNYQGKYFATATVRYDKSSRFLGDNQSDIFPSFSGGWLLSKEDFYPEDALVSRIKLKGSWGELGNQTLPGNNLTSNVYNLSQQYGDYSFNGSTITSGAVLSSVGNPNLKWETSVTTNFGVDLGLFDNALYMSLEYFNIVTNDLIAPNNSLISTTAIDANAPYVNLGSVKNTGVDFSAGYGNETESGFSYNVSANISSYKNEVTELISDFQGGRGLRNNTVVTRTQVGEPISSFFGLNAIGFDGEGRFIYQDVNSDGTINDSDRKYIGSPHPDFTYGFNFDFAYKGFDMNLFFAGSQGNEIYNFNLVYTDFPTFFNANRTTRTLDSWTPENTGASLPALSSQVVHNGIDDTGATSHFVEDASYLKLKNLQIGYSLSDDLVDKMKMNSLRVYLQASNLFTLTDYSGYDPEIIPQNNLSLGIDSGIYPASKIYTIGVNIKF